MSRSDGEKNWKGWSWVCPGHRNGGESQRLSRPPRSRQQAKENPLTGTQSAEVLSSLLNLVLVKCNYGALPFCTGKRGNDFAGETERGGDDLMEVHRRAVRLCLSP